MDINRQNLIYTPRRGRATIGFLFGLFYGTPLHKRDHLYQLSYPYSFDI